MQKRTNKQNEKAAKIVSDERPSAESTSQAHGTGSEHDHGRDKESQDQDVQIASSRDFPFRFTRPFGPSDTSSIADDEDSLEMFQGRFTEGSFNQGTDYEYGTGIQICREYVADYSERGA